jgi:heme exporter protein D
MTSGIRARIMVLQVIAILILAFGAGAAFYASNFSHQQVHDQLAPQQISFPASAAQGLPADLSQYAGQQVLNGYQAHAYAENFIALHLSEIGKGHPYSYWSGLALNDSNPTTKAQEQAIADTLFKGETLRSMLNQAWTFWVIGDIAFYAGVAFAVATVLVLAAFIFEIVAATRKTSQPVLAQQTAPSLAA